MTTNKPEALELARRTIRQLSNAERDRILEQYLSDGIAVDKARIAELEAALISVREQPAPAVQGEPVGYVSQRLLDALRSGKACGITMEDKPDAHNGVTTPLYAASAVQGELVAWATRLYNTAYHAGHHDTVEGVYTHVCPQDMDSYHEDIVQEWLAAYNELTLYSCPREGEV